MNFLSQNSSESNPSIDILKSTLIAFFDKVSEGTELHAKNRATFEEKVITPKDPIKNFLF
jgi:hypothetical protein